LSIASREELPHLISQFERFDFASKDDPARRTHEAGFGCFSVGFGQRRFGNQSSSTTAETVQELHQHWVIG